MQQEKIQNYFQIMDYDENVLENTDYKEVIEWINNNNTIHFYNDSDYQNKSISVESSVTKEVFKFTFEELCITLDKDCQKIIKDFKKSFKQHCGLICKLNEFFYGTPIKYSTQILIPAIEKLFANIEDELFFENTMFMDPISKYTNLWEAVKEILYNLLHSKRFVDFEVGSEKDVPILVLLQRLLSKSGFFLHLKFNFNFELKVDFIQQIPMIVFNGSDLHSASAIAIESAFCKPPIVGKIDTIFIEESAMDSFIEKLKSKLNTVQEMQIAFQKESLEIVEKESKVLGLNIHQVNVKNVKATIIIGGKPFSNMEIIEKKLYNAAVLYVIPFRTKEDVLALLKKIPSTFGASIWSENVSIINDMSQKIPMKHIWINCCGTVEYQIKNNIGYRFIDANLEKVQLNWNNTKYSEKLKLIMEFLNSNNFEFIRELKKELQIFLEHSMKKSFSYNTDNYLITNIKQPIGQIEFEIHQIQRKEIFLILAALIKGNVVSLFVCSTKVEQFKNVFKIFIEKGIIQFGYKKKDYYLNYIHQNVINDNNVYHLINEFETVSKQIWMPL